MYSTCQEESVCRGSAWKENMESLQADWKRKTISNCNLIPLLDNTPESLMEFHLFLHLLQLRSELLYPLTIFSQFLHRVRQLVVLELSSFLPFSCIISDLSISENLSLQRLFFL